MGIPWGLDELETHYSPNWYRVYRAAKLPKHKWPAADQIWRENYAKHNPNSSPAPVAFSRDSALTTTLGLVTSGGPATASTAS